MSLGKEKAKQYLEANEEAIKNIEKIIQQEQIECEFQKKDAYVFTQKQDEIQKIKKEVEAVQSLGFPAEYVENIELPLKTLGAIKFPNQAQFNPCKYIQGLVEAMPNVEIYENTKVVDLKTSAKVEAEKTEKNSENVKQNEKEEQSENIKQNEIEKQNENKEQSKSVKQSETERKNENKDRSENIKQNEIEKQNKNEEQNQTEYEIITENKNKINAKYVVIATHYPIINIPGYYFLKMYQSLSYVIGAETKKQELNGMYINSEEPTISIRTTTMKDGKTLLIVAGMDHKTGEKKDLSQKYEELIKIAKKIDPNCEIKYKWCTEDCISLDKIPYIGEFSSLMPNVYVGTGYKKWGMTSSNVAANIIVNKILGKQNSYEEVFTSTRLKPIKNREELGNMIKEVTKSLIIEKLKIPQKTIKDIKKGEAKIIEIDSKKVGVYKDEEENLYAVKPVCTHLGCELSWNNLEKTWDCPCHGSRFTFEGKSIYDPSIHDLESIELE